MLKKQDYVIENIQALKDLLMCPICNATLYLDNMSLKCPNNHCFDISRKGCLTLLKNNQKRTEKVYDFLLFNNRISFINGPFYEKMHKVIADIINKQKTSKIILDMGCGDGTHDYKIFNLLNNKESYLIGIDLAKDGIDYFSNYVSNHFVPIVADLNHVPILDKKVDIILNILSPSSEKEMTRLLKSGGIIIKVTPKKDYLKELREALNIKNYENEEIIEQNIYNHYDVKNKLEINEVYELDHNYLDNLLKMTPLSKNKNTILNIKSITIALNIYVLTPKY